MAQTLFPNNAAEDSVRFPGIVRLSLLSGERIVRLRKELRLKRAEAARAIGVHPHTLLRAEREQDILLSNAHRIINWLYTHGAYAIEIVPLPEAEKPQ